METSKQLEMIPPSERKLDIVSELMIDMQLENIAGDILSNLSDMDIANTVVANPKWSAILPQAKDASKGSFRKTKERAFGPAKARANRSPYPYFFSTRARHCRA